MTRTCKGAIIFKQAGLESQYEGEEAAKADRKT